MSRVCSKGFQPCFVGDLDEFPIDFLNYTIKKRTELYNSTGTWDNGYPSGGNYCSDYTERYPNAKEIDGSGLWTTPYVLDEANRNNYPLMSQVPPPETTASTIQILALNRRNLLHSNGSLKVQ